MSQAWLSIAIILWLVQLAVLFFVARPAFKALAAGDASARAQVMASTGVTHLILLVMLLPHDLEAGRAEPRVLSRSLTAG